MADKLKCVVVGATGMVGQRFLTLLENHPYFQVTGVAASARSAGRNYSEAVEGRWKMQAPIPERVKDMTIIDASDIKAVAGICDFIFCAVDMPKDQIKILEESYAKAEIPVISNNSANRWTEDVPMVIPEINPEHLQVINYQKKRLGTKKGFIAVKPNCSIQSYVPALTPLRKFGIRKLLVTTYQAISGAGKNFETWPEMVRKIIPYIGGEEEKSELEPLKVFGHIEGDEIITGDCMRISAQCIRVPVLNGHTATVSVKFRKKPTKEQLIEKLRAFKGLPQEYALPSAPKQFIQYLEDDNRPQVALDVNYENGMGISIGRIREDSIYDFKFVGLSHNTLRGAAGGGVEAAEMLVKLGYITKK